MNILTNNTALLRRQCNELARCIGVEAPIRVLLVSDSDDDRTALRDVLAQANGARYVVESVKSHREAESAIQAGRHDIYIVDQRLNGESGGGFVKRLHDDGVRFPCVLLASESCGVRGCDGMMVMHRADFTKPREIDRALRFSMKNWMTSRSVELTSSFPPMAAPA